jgi:hypothetical protein
MPLKFKTESPNEQTYMNVLLYGPPKTGKTIGAASAPPPILYLNADMPNATRLARQLHPGALLEPEIGEGEWLASMIEIQQQVANGPRTVETVVVDPLGELYTRLLLDVSKKALRPTLPNRGDVTTYIERFCRALCELPVNVVFVAHENNVVGDEGATDYVPFTGTSNTKLANKIGGMVDVIGYTAVIEQEGGGKQYVASLIPNKGRRGGDRFDVLGDYRTVNIAEWVDLARTAESRLTAERTEPQADDKQSVDTEEKAA